MVSLSKGLLQSLCIATALFVAVGSSAHGQQVFGSIAGTVTDPSGSAVANAKVTITDTTKGTSSDVMTNDAGQYTKGQLIPDAYKVTIEAAGFQKVESSELTVQVDQATQFNASMQVGNVNQTVEVTAAAPLLQTDRADVAQTFTSEQISQLPSIGRNLQAFTLLNPGTVSTGWQHAADENPQGSVQMIVNGQLFDSTGYYLDGTINQDPILGIIVINPTFDSVNEVKQANQDYDAEYGYTSAGVNTYSTKSGTNAFHGDAFEYLFVNTPGFQDFGRNPFSQNTPIPGRPGAFTPTTRQNQFGGSLSGKIIKDKLFYFADTQLNRQTIGGSLLTTVPSLLNRTGDFSDYLAVNPINLIYDPNTGNANGTGRTPFSYNGKANVIPPSRLSPQALALLQYFPLPNTVGTTINGIAAPFNNYEGSGALTNNGNLWDTRWDYYLNEKNTFFGRYSYATFQLQAPGVFGEEGGGQAFNNTNYAGSSSTFNESIAAGWTHTANATLINEFRFGYMRYHVTDVPNGYGTTPATAAGIPGLNLDQTTSALPYFEIDFPNSTTAQTSLGYALGNNTHCNCPLDQLERQYQFVDNISKIHGNHNFKFGADVRYALNLRIPSDNHRAGQLFFFPNVTGDVPTAGANPTGGVGMATFMLGDVSQFNRYVSSSLNAQERQKRLFWYGQDEWHVSPKLTVTLGLRWEWVFPETVNVAGNGAELNVNTGQMDVYGVGLTSIHGYQNMNWREFAPRASVAYQIKPKTVVRAGYGWSYSLGTFGNNFGHNVTQNPPVLLNQTLNQNSPGGCPTNFCDVFTLAQGPSAPNLAPYQPGPNGTFPWPGNTVSAFTRPGTLTMPVLYAYNFTVQQQITPKIVVSGGYVGNSGRHTLIGTDQNFNINQQYFLPGSSSSNTATYPYAGLLGPRYNYGWTTGVNDFCNCGVTQYNSFQTLFKVNAWAGWTLQGNYTYQSVKGDGWGGNEAYTFLYDRPLGYGNNQYMPHNQWVLAQNYNIPFGRGRKFGANVNKWVDAALGGWNISGITTFYSGLPFMPTIENYGTGIQPYTGPNNRPNVGSGSPYAANQNRAQWILPLSSGAYTLPASNTFGNYPINTLIGPHFINQDASLSKQFSITERLKFMLRVDSTNFFNHANLGQPNADIQSGNVGQITQLANQGNYQMRRLQFSGSINF